MGLIDRVSELTGICFKCGQETTNQYEYYSADIVSKETWEKLDNRGITMSTYIKTTYANFEKHLGYYCTVCANKGKGPVLIILGSLIAIMGVFLAAIVILFEATEMIIWSLLPIIAAIVCLYFGINVKKRGKPFSANRGSTVVASMRRGDVFAGKPHNKILGIKKDGVVYFTPDEYDRILMHSLKEGDSLKVLYKNSRLVAPTIWHWYEC